MCVPVIFQGIQQIFDMYAGLRFSLYAQTASEKEGIRVLLTGGQLPEIDKIAADGHIRPAMKRRLQGPVVNQEIKPGMGVPDMYPDGFPFNLPEAHRKCLSTHEVVETSGKNGSMECVRHDTQRQLQWEQ